MTTHTIALFDIGAEEATAERLCAIFTADSGFASALIARYRHLWSIPTWTITSTSVSSEPKLVGPGGFALRWHGRTLELYHKIRPTQDRYSKVGKIGRFVGLSGECDRKQRATF